MRVLSCLILIITLTYASSVNKGSSLLKAYEQRGVKLSLVGGIGKSQSHSVNPLKVTTFDLYTDWTNRAFARIGADGITDLLYVADVCNLAQLEADGKNFLLTGLLPFNPEWNKAKGAARLEVYNTEKLNSESQALITNYNLTTSGPAVIDQYYQQLGWPVLESDFPDHRVYIVVSSGNSGQAADVSLHLKVTDTCESCGNDWSWLYGVTHPPSLDKAIPLRQYANLDGEISSVEQFTYNHHHVIFCRPLGEVANNFGVKAVITAVTQNTGIAGYMCENKNANICENGAPEKDVLKDWSQPNSAYVSLQYAPNQQNDLDVVVAVLGFGNFPEKQQTPTNQYRISFFEV